MGTEDLYLLQQPKLWVFPKDPHENDLREALGRSASTQGDGLLGPHRETQVWVHHCHLPIE